VHRRGSKVDKVISMAFQKKYPFFSFLQSMASGTTLEEVAPAENYILDERLPDAREEQFFNFNGFSKVVYNKDSWFKQHTDYTRNFVALPTISGTFTAINAPNCFSPSPDWDVVRLETISGMRSRARGSDVEESEAADLIKEMLLARNSGDTLDPFREARLEKWIQRVNGGGDRRPAFVVPFAEVESVLAQPDWANRLRDALGLGHIRPSGGNPAKVVLMQYNLIRVHNAHIGKPAWAANPAVLDDVSGQMPNPCFFPAPKKALSDKYGFTVDFSSTGATYLREFLHAHISYELVDIRNIGFVTEDVLPARIAKARNSHFELLKDDLFHCKDLPDRP
jgi:hypothetical protein